MSKESNEYNRSSSNRIQNLSIAIIVIITIAVIAVAVYVIVSRVTSLNRGQSNYDNIAASAVSQTYEYIPVEEEAEVEEEVYSDPRGEWLADSDGINAYKMNVDADELLKVNEDYLCWIYGCGGDIDYPVCQSADNQFYLKHGFDKKSNVYGSLFTELLDNGILYTDAVIYGHHMKNGTMFNKLNEYKNEQYYHEHPYFYFFTNRGDAQFEIFSVYNIDMGVLEEIQEQEEGLSRDECISNMKSRSLYDTGVDVSGDDYIITLVTCEYSSDNGRMIVHCRKNDN